MNWEVFAPDNPYVANSHSARKIKVPEKMYLRSMIN